MQWVYADRTTLCLMNLTPSNPTMSRLGHNATGRHRPHAWRISPTSILPRLNPLLRFIPSSKGLIMAAATLPPETKVDPTSHRDAVSRPEPEATEWRESKIEEYESHVQNNTVGRRPRRCHLGRGLSLPTLCTKRSAVGAEEDTRCHTRLLAPGIDYNETFCSCCSIGSKPSAP